MAGLHLGKKTQRQCDVGHVVAPLALPLFGYP
jgi:hypothetical protein